MDKPARDAQRRNARVALTPGYRVITHSARRAAARQTGQFAGASSTRHTAAACFTAVRNSTASRRACASSEPPRAEQRLPGRFHRRARWHAVAQQTVVLPASSII